ncbi:ANTAR domain-containing protein [Streptomyces sp. NPDC060187]|uniref:ANTAR domain-containing protein n=1 Tax=Streptomyces sp. NPDC060187 TaxID=3347067 RepID=UPI003659A487
MDHENRTWLKRVHSENEQLKRTGEAYAAVHQALGVLIARCQIPPEQGYILLNEMARHLEEELPVLAAEITQWGLGQPLRPAVEKELGKLTARG